MHGDFLLTANRLHIDTSSTWNQALRDGMGDVFMRFVEHATRSSLKYTWPYFVPNSDTSNFFQPARDYILKRLHESQFLESSAGTPCLPLNLIFVDPTKYADDDGRPFTMSEGTGSRYLSSNYPSWTIESILDLGVGTLTDETFLQDLEFVISTNTTAFNQRPASWHSQLAKALSPLADNPELNDVMSRLPIIPLFDGGWTSVDEQPVLFMKGIDAANFPLSALIAVVDSVAALDDSRRSLFERLGVQDIDNSGMCHRIAAAHASPAFIPEQLNKAELIRHATLLFEASWQPPEDVQNRPMVRHF
jgi:hypothetical protein